MYIFVIYAYTHTYVRAIQHRNTFSSMHCYKKVDFPPAETMRIYNFK